MVHTSRPKALSSQAILSLCLTLFLAGCALRPDREIVLGPSHAPQNIFKAQDPLPDRIRRLAVLPLTSDNSVNAEIGRAQLEPALRQTLARQESFELWFVSPEDLYQWFGTRSLNASEKLPADLLPRLRDQTACDAILFSRLTLYQAYPPLMVGWNFKLIDAEEPSVWWAADTLFNAGEPAVANSARRYHQTHAAAGKQAKDSRSILLSPSQFGEYTLQSVFETLPPR